jgi:hypothetical protein
MPEFTPEQSARIELVQDGRMVSGSLTLDEVNALIEALQMTKRHGAI